MGQAWFVLAAPLSHCSPLSILPLPQPTQSAGHEFFVSPFAHTPSPQYGPVTMFVVQLVVHVEHVSGGL